MMINLAIPAHNEEPILAENIKKLGDFCRQKLTDDWFIVIADNASTDQTGEAAKKIAKKGLINYLFIPHRGKGVAVKTAWQKFPADFYIFMDADLSTDLTALPLLIDGLKNGADIVIGSRYLPKSQTNRSIIRIIISKIYRFLGRQILGLPFSDLPCGFKGVNQKIIEDILPQLKNQQWFFDTELLYRAYQAGYQIKEIPVIWTETPNQKRKNKIGLIKVGWEYLKEMYKLKIAP